MGWLSPVIIKAKILIQTMWLQHWTGISLSPRRKSGLGELFATSSPSGERARASLDTVQGIKHDLEVHGFADASERAYAAVVYLRTRGVEGERRVFLLQAKTKVAPAQPVSLPRLELCAAALLAKLTAHVVKVMDIASAPLHLWSDSTVTLAWIQSHPSRWKTYVANRVADIQRRLPTPNGIMCPEQRTQQTARHEACLPATCRIMGCGGAGRPGCLETPRFLRARRCRWVTRRRRGVRCILQRSNQPRNVQCCDDSQCCSGWRVTAWCCRWLGERRVPYTPMSALSPQELEAARLRWIRHVQSWEFAEERRALSRGVAVPRRSVLARLDPFVDRNGVLRVGGRLKHAVLNPDERHPIILPRRSHFAVLVIRECHRRAMHGGVQLTLGWSGKDTGFREDAWRFDATFIAASLACDGGRRPESYDGDTTTAAGNSIASLQPRRESTMRARSRFGQQQVEDTSAQGLFGHLVCFATRLCTSSWCPVMPRMPS
ncbi:uncharacterized protein LOC114934887 [Nylanderia fulva]|uniref:uncharacterized protein LOC114934887 n=1 Tax=Nylanderia fulva TaxID=613905 RepID=UPI0010FB5921|nr:uncharacterized protein LOC114934887 [Nylanderia fulva]